MPTESKTSPQPRKPRGADKAPRKRRADKPGGRPPSGEESRNVAVTVMLSQTAASWLRRQPSAGAAVESLIRASME